MTDLQDQIMLELNKFGSIEEMRDHADEISAKIGCSRQYVFRLIKKREVEGVPTKISVEPAPTPEIETEDAEGSDIETEVIESGGLSDVSDQDFETPEPEKEKEQETLDEIVTLENVGTLVNVPFRLVAILTDFSDWELTEPEKSRLAPMARKILIKYLPDVMTKYFVEVVFLIVVIEVIGEKGKRWRDSQKKQAQTQELEAKAKEQAEAREKAAQAAKEAAEAPEVEASTEEKPKRTKEQSGTPSWMKDGRKIG